MAAPMGETGDMTSVVERGRPRVRVRAVALDLGIAVVLLVVGPRSLWEWREHQWLAPILAFGLVAPLLLRRRWPLVTFGVIAGVAFVQWLAGRPPVVADAALLVALYSVAVSRPWRRTLLAVAVLELGCLLAVLRYGPPEPGAGFLPFVFLSGLVTAASVLGANVRVRREYLREVEQRAVRLEFERDQQAQLAASAERARVAREMHDIVAHNLSVMIALTDGASLTLAADPARAGEALAEASRAGRAALTDMRRVLGLLRDSADPAALTPAPGIAELDALITAVRRTGLRVHYRAEGALSAFEPGLQLSAYRIVQEAITNTMKHAHGAGQIDIRLLARAGGLEVVVTDDGPEPAGGVDTAAGHGIAGMRERAAVHRGEVTAGPLPAGGWLVRAWLPAMPVPDEPVRSLEPA